MSKKKYDLAVKVGSYQDRNGETKNRWENIGVVIQGNDGYFMMLKKTFNPAGVPDPENRESILVSMFEPREKGAQQQAQGQHNASHQAQAPQQQGGGFDDDIPFANPYKGMEHMV